MPSTNLSPQEYLTALPEDRKQAITQLRSVIRKSLPEGFTEVMSSGMLAYVVPHSVYSGGYHADTTQPLPFISIASQKNYVAVYHMGIYGDPELLNWFRQEYAKRVKGKLDMGKSCIRFKKVEEIPYALLGELASKMTPARWIAIYESQVKK